MKSLDLAIRSNSTVLILGPTGSGKSSLAREIHDRGARRLKPFVTVNLASVHEGTLESELFGHERGAFTGADQRRVGRLEAAQGGTVFLDEIGDISPRLQARLLEFLQSKTIVPVGGNREIQLDVRIIAATHRDLSAAVREGSFREDLFHRLRFLSLLLKPLIDRDDEEFDRLVHGILSEACQNAGRQVLRISEDVARRLESYGWPGNIRELKAVLEYAVLSSQGSEILLSDLPAWMVEDDFLTKELKMSFDRSTALGVAELEMSLDYHRSLVEFEREYLERALRRFRGRINFTARQIGLNKTTLIRRIRFLGIDIEALFIPPKASPEAGLKGL